MTAPEERKDLISRVMSLAAEDFGDLCEGARISTDTGHVTVYTNAQVRDALSKLSEAFQQTVDDGENLEDWS